MALSMNFVLPTDQNSHPVHDPLSMFKISDQDQSNDIKYYGFLGADGSAYIQKWNTLTDTFRYFFTKNDFVTAWNARISQPYDYFSVIF